MQPCFEKLRPLRSQKESGLQFNFLGAIYTIIPKDGEEPRFVQPLGNGAACRRLIDALVEAKKQNSVVIAAWVGEYRTDMFCIDDIDLVIQQLSK